ncbi:TPA: hypothetical protein L9P83_005540 [Klebsiella pneumoniae]|nr:hypothetical protein [Klebsiella pneumoniae]
MQRPLASGFSRGCSYSKKHLITLQSLISTNQLEEMRYHQLQLVIPSPVLALYSPDSQGFLMPLSEFIGVVKGTTLV